MPTVVCNLSGSVPTRGLYYHGAVPTMGPYPSPDASLTRAPKSQPLARWHQQALQALQLLPQHLQWVYFREPFPAELCLLGPALSVLFPAPQEPGSLFPISLIPFLDETQPCPRASPDTVILSSSSTRVLWHLTSP